MDYDETNVKRVSDKLTHVVVGDPMESSVLNSLGVKNFDCAIVAISDNVKTNIITTMALKEMGVKYVVARATSEMHKKVLEKVGADRIVFPENDMGNKLANTLSISNIIDYIDIFYNYSISEIKTPPHWVGKSLAELKIRPKYNISVIAIKNNDDIKLSLDPHEPLKEDDVLCIVGKYEALAKVME